MKGGRKYQQWYQRFKYLSSLPSTHDMIYIWMLRSSWTLTGVITSNNKPKIVSFNIFYSILCQQLCITIATICHACLVLLSWHYIVCFSCAVQKLLSVYCLPDRTKEWKLGSTLRCPFTTETLPLAVRLNYFKFGTFFCSLNSFLVLSKAFWIIPQTCRLWGSKCSFTWHFIDD